MAKAIPIKAMTFDGVLEKHKKYVQDSVNEIRRNGGLCIECGLNPIEEDSGLNDFKCKVCNDKTRAILKKMEGIGLVQIHTRG